MAIPLFDGFYDSINNIKDAVYAREYYAKLVEVLRRSNSNAHYFNRYPWQVKLVFDNLLAYAEETIESKEQPSLCMFSGDVDFYFLQKDIDKRLSALADQGCVIDILLANPPSNDAMYRWRRLAKMESVNVKKMSKYDEKLYHVWVYDDAFRLEEPHPQLKSNMTITDIKPERRAEFAFHDQAAASAVRAYFNKHFNASETLS